jgi:uncharacterized protein YaeQ
VPIDASRALAQMAARSMRLQITLQEGSVLVADGAISIPMELRILKTASMAR